jgi:hypothetical protein
MPFVFRNADLGSQSLRRTLNSGEPTFGSSCVSPLHTLLFLNKKRNRSKAEGF